MYKGTDIVGKPVVAVENGAVVGKIKDIIFDSEAKQVLGFLVEEKGLFHDARIIPFAKVKAIGTDAVTIPGEFDIIKASADPAIHNAIHNKGMVTKGTPIVSEGGQELGSISDLFFDEVSGMLEGYEVSNGIFKDAYQGKAFMPATHFRKGEDLAVVPNEIAEFMESQVGGIKSAALNAKGTASELQDVMGKRTSKTIRDVNGSIIVPEGQVITEAVYEKAKRMKVEAELLTAAGASTAAESSKTARSNFKQSWGMFRDKAKEKISTLKEQTSGEIEERRINAALGRPVTRVILDKNDNVILNVGEMITHQAIDQARAAGVLEILLSSVTKDQPRFTSDELKSIGV